jgi:hypothetical protein
MKLPDVVIARWDQAVEANDAMNWRALSELAHAQYSLVKAHEPDSIVYAALAGVAVEAYNRYQELMAH